MDHTSSAHCPRCGASLDQGSVDGLCAKCLGALNFATDTALPGESAAAIPPPAPEEIAAHFPQLEVIEFLGRGGMGVVYKARQKALGRLVALKLLAPERVADPKFAERFAHEAKALAALNHPSIVTIHDFGQAGGFFYLLMEFVDGVNLRQAMQAGRFTPEQALAIVPPVCEALQYAHEHGIVHRDIKPENLLLDKEGRVKIADFGIAKMLGDDSDVGLGESQPAGTPQYMAPEQKAHQRTDHRADIYSLGVVLYELLTGELPADKLQAPSRKVQIDVRLDEIVLRALEKSPELRFQTAADFRTQVETIADAPSSANSEYVSSWGFRLTAGPAIKTGYVHFWERRFGSIESAGAINALNLSRIGYIGLLAPLAILPGWRWCWPAFCFLGMFGLIGVAYLSETAARRGVDLSKTGGLPDPVSQRAAWRTRVFQLIIGGSLVPMVSFAVSVIVLLTLGGEKVIEAATIEQMLFVFVKVLGLGAGLALLIWAVMRAFRKKANPWPQNPEALIAMGMLWPLLLIAAPIFLWEFVSATRPQNARMSAEEWLLFGVVACFVLHAAVLVTSNVRRTIREANDPSARREPEPPAQPRWQGWDVWVIGLCLVTYGGLWLFSLSQKGLNRSVLNGRTETGDIVLHTAVATVILLASTAFLWMLAKNIKTPSTMRTESWKRQFGRSIVPTFAAVLLLRTFIMQTFWSVTDATAPEIPRGSLVLVWKPARTFAAGELIAYIESGRVNLGRITTSSQGAVFVRRNGSEPASVLHSDIVGKVLSVLWRATPGAGAPDVPPSTERTGKAAPVSFVTAPWSPSPAPIGKEDVRQISADAKALQELGRYEEALQRHLWLHHHASEIAPGFFGVRLSFWLSDWVALAQRYPKAKQALIEIRDRKSRELAAGRGQFELFADVDSINSYLQDDAATLALFKQIGQANPDLTSSCAPLAEEAARRLAEPGERGIAHTQLPLEKALADLQAAKAERDLLPSKSFPSEAHQENEALRIERRIELFEEVAARRRAELEQSLSKP